MCVCVCMPLRFVHDTHDDASCPIDVITKGMMENELRIVVKWSGKEYDILDIQEDDTVLTLKERIHRETGVRPERQKLLNLKFKGYVLNRYSWIFC